MEMQPVFVEGQGDYKQAVQTGEIAGSLLMTNKQCTSTTAKQVYYTIYICTCSISTDITYEAIKFVSYFSII